MPLFTNRWKSFATPPTFADAIQANALGDDSQFEFADQSPTAGKMPPPEPIIPSQRQDSMDAMRKLPTSRPPIASPNLPDVPEIQEPDINRNMGRSPVDQSIMEVGESDLPASKLPPQPNAITKIQQEIQAMKMPEHQKPGLLRTLAAAGLGAAAGWNNADWRRNRPIDVSGVTSELMHPEAGAMREYGRQMEDLQGRLKTEEQAQNVLSQIQNRSDLVTAREDQNKLRRDISRENAEARREGVRALDARSKAEQESRALENERRAEESAVARGAIALPKGMPIPADLQARIDARKVVKLPSAGLTGNDVYFDYEASKLAGKTPPQMSDSIALAARASGKQTGNAAIDTLSPEEAKSTFNRMHPGPIPVNLNFAPNASGEPNAMIGAVANYESPLVSSRGKDGPQQRAAQIAEIKKVNPNWTEQGYRTVQAFTTGREAQTVNALNTLGGHLATLDAAVKSLKNGDVTMLNRIANGWGLQTGSTAPAVYDAIVHRVAPELVRVYAGSVAGEGDRRLSESDFDKNRGPAQLKGAIQATTHLAKSKMEALRHQFENGAPGAKFDRFIQPETKESFDRILGVGGGPKVGDTKTFPNGKTGKWDGKGWVAQ